MVCSLLCLFLLAALTVRARCHRVRAAKQLWLAVCLGLVIMYIWRHAAHGDMHSRMRAPYATHAYPNAAARMSTCIRVCAPHAASGYATAAACTPACACSIMEFALLRNTYFVAARDGVSEFRCETLLNCFVATVRAPRAAH